MKPQKNLTYSQLLSQTDSQIFNNQIEEYKFYNKNRQQQHNSNQVIPQQQEIPQEQVSIIQKNHSQEEEFFDIIPQQTVIHQQQQQQHRQLELCPYCQNQIHAEIMHIHLQQCYFEKFVCQYCGKQFSLSMRDQHENNCEVKEIIQQQALQIQLADQQIYTNQNNSNSDISEEHNIQHERNQNENQIFDGILKPIALGVFEFIIEQLNQLQPNRIENFINDLFNSDNTRYRPEQRSNQQQEIQQLNSFIFQESPDQRTTSSSCTICQSEYNRQDRVMRLACGHIYHSSCIRQWLRSRPICPVCKSNVQIN